MLIIPKKKKDSARILWDLQSLPAVRSMRLLTQPRGRNEMCVVLASSVRKSIMTRPGTCVPPAETHHQLGNANLSFRTVSWQPVHSLGNLGEVKKGRRGVASIEKINHHHEILRKTATNQVLANPLWPCKFVGFRTPRYCYEGSLLCYSQILLFRKSEGLMEPCSFSFLEDQWPALLLALYKGTKVLSQAEVLIFWNHWDIWIFSSNKNVN